MIGVSPISLASTFYALSVFFAVVYRPFLPLHHSAFGIPRFPLFPTSPSAEVRLLEGRNQLAQFLDMRQVRGLLRLHRLDHDLVKRGEMLDVLRAGRLHPLHRRRGPRHEPGRADEDPETIRARMGVLPNQHLVPQRGTREGMPGPADASLS